MRRFLAACTLVLTITAALAMTRPAELDGSIASQKPYGSGSLTWLFFTAYDASLWTDAGVWSMDAPFALVVVYRMSFTTEELVERTIEEMEKVSPALRGAAARRYAVMLARAFPNVKAGDRITAVRVPGRPVRFYFNGKASADISDPELAGHFFAIWLSPNTSEPALRAKLLNVKR